MNILKATIATAAITVCCMGNEIPAKGQSMPSFRPITTQQRAVCVRQLKNSLRDPWSFKRLGSGSQENKTGLIKYSAKNGFGGRMTAYYDCNSGQNFTL